MLFRTLKKDARLGLFNDLRSDSCDQLAVATIPSTTTTLLTARTRQIEVALSRTTRNVWDYENQRTRAVMRDGLRVTMVYNANFRRTRKES